MDDLNYCLMDLDLPTQLNTLSKAIRYSTITLERLTKLNSINYEELTIITLFRKLIENVDGIFVLADHGLKSPCITVIRAAYEVFLQIEYMFKDEKNVHQKTLSYYSCWLYEEIEFIERELKNNRSLIPKDILVAKKENNNKLLDEKFSDYKREIYVQNQC
jgi:Family of unknown function (DUF5677)